MKCLEMCYQVVMINSLKNELKIPAAYLIARTEYTGYEFSVASVPSVISETELYIR